MQDQLPTVILLDLQCVEFKVRKGIGQGLGDRMIGRLWDLQAISNARSMEAPPYPCLVHIQYGHRLRSSHIAPMPIIPHRIITPNPMKLTRPAM